ncbi:MULTISPECIES: oligosaccharide flippase family protein [Bosea]|uniref:oligosaccharide flippase family protein n=1 Tax=Bosea TaxID=85413 RepID=UPI00214FCC3C|nr:MULTISPECIES: oligosaccharide flippase family protein [Bosea]MCR4523804.1 oligosaccharide flippase family protein [Bosea sp. 47.2.35]MDR6830378.1 O-antigen/teichoic acid export membrane protein [Bosea robiniae]MDR6897133.1 O-antigen/teichoic acid export membrane protein [Bosea sp. BE109]MDR7140530.1 O-antigen/teichoic acid export membrane protein [Bosea sp. BE168]MDR7177149.1 O-antigen/teichoic acid export membrane protein [Bosea sp. BE271]
MTGTGLETGGGEAHKGTSIATGVLWNIAALGFLAVAGIVLNLVVGRVYGPATLGVFNVAFAVYIFLSQIAAFGLQFSALHSVSVMRGGHGEALSRTVYGGLLLCAGIGGLVTLASILAAPLIAALFPRVPDLSTAWLLVAPGLLPFALNKYMLGVINGMQHMRAFAVLQAGRFIGILIGLGVMILAGLPGIYLTFILALAEFLLAGVAGAYLMKVVPRPSVAGMSAEMLRHARFGMRVFPAGMVAELNTRVDVLMIGALLNDTAAGIYTIASLVYEAALQAVVVLRNNINPRLARDIMEHQKEHILAFSRRLGVLVTVLAAVGAFVAIIGFPLFASLAFPGKEFSGASEPLFWLMLALVFAAAPLCYSLILSQAGRPGWQSVGMVAMLTMNLIFNALLIPKFGIAGAGMAMGLSTVLGGALIVALSRFVLGVRLFF